MEEKKVNKEAPPRGSGLSVKQLNQQLDQFEGQLVQFEQAKILLEFDKENYAETLNRKIRMNNDNLELVKANIAVIKKQIKKTMRNHN